MGGFGKLGGRLRSLIAVGLLGMAAASAGAQALPTAPSVKPREVHQSTWLAGPEFQSLANALDSADNNRWSDVRAALARISDPGAKALLRWRMAIDGNSGMGFADLNQAMADFKGWPDTDKIAGAAETAITNSALPASERITWLTARGPTTGEGVLALADAYNSQAMNDDMIRVVKKAWGSQQMSSDAARTMEATYGRYFTADDYWARIDMLLWRDNIPGAQSYLSRVSSERKLLANARIALMKNQRKGIDAALAAVPSSLENDPGLLFQRARWRERKGDEDGELALMVRVKGPDAPEYARADIWNEKQSIVRRLIRERNYSVAYQLAAEHGLKTGDAFRDAEWTAGWLALTKLSDPARGEAHFRTFGAGVTAPISVARAGYWLGEALAAQNRKPEALVAYQGAAKYPYVFYGQLAAGKITAAKPDATTLAFERPAAPTDADRTAFAHRPVIRAAILLAETGRLATFERFSNYIDDTLANAQEHQMLFDIAQGYLETRAAVRGGKAGLARGLIAPDAVFPLLDLPKSPRSGSAEPALVLALSRQESEFNPMAVSPADARGLMQLVPRYAEAEARKLGLPYRANWLTDDPQYNLKVGRGFLDDLVDQYNGSYIMAAAAYNAGPSRVHQWVNDYGDPRGSVDPVQWIESIPFSETRNYVQRVLENTEVYRYRLAGRPTRVTLLEDLKRGRPGIVPDTEPLPDLAPEPDTAAQDSEAPAPSISSKPTAAVASPVIEAQTRSPLEGEESAPRPPEPAARTDDRTELRGTQPAPIDQQRRR